MTSQNFANTTLYDVKAKLVSLSREQRNGINKLLKIYIDLTSCSTYRHFSSTCKWYLLFANNNFVEKEVLKIVNRIYILLGNNHLGNIFAEVITIKTLFASAKPLTIADCRGEFRGLLSVHKKGLPNIFFKRVKALQNDRRGKQLLLRLLHLLHGQ